MEFLSDDPTYLAGGLAIVGVIFLIALKTTQQGKHLIHAGIAFGLALLVLGIEWMWVTDKERVEDTVYGLAKAVAASDGPKAAEFLDPKCVIETGPEATNRYINQVIGIIVGPPGEWLRQHLSEIKFDYLRVTRVNTQIRESSRTATVECLAHAAGEKHDPFQTFMVPPGGMGWSFGLREVEPKVWKITRISPGRFDMQGLTTSVR